MKKAQLMSQPFYYIFIIIVIALILYFGFNLIGKLRETQERATWAEFKIDFEKDLENVLLKNPGTKITSTILVPKDATKVCFQEFTDNDKVYSDSLFSTSFNVNNLIHDENPYCINVKSQRIEFTLENTILNNEKVVIIS